MRAVADLSRGVIHASVEIDAPPERVWDAITEPSQLASWWGGELYRTYDWSLDLRPGGAWSTKADGKQGLTTVHGEILELERPHRLVMSWHASWDGDARTVLRYELSETSRGTLVRVVLERFVDRPASCENHTQGWHLVLGWLEAFSGAHAP
ncbi:MAG: SRPBCC domain-containing protein [Sandaracinaceae bacterium]|nr:SRPBCC domain-containing protein [Sandaracinaceae bacterium]